MNHTPGPWVVEADNVFPPGRRGKRTPIPTMLMVVAEKGGMPGLIVNQGPIEPRDYANARLIAAAPDLLAAAKKYMETCPADYDTTKAFKAASIALEAAIAKAEGNS